MYFSDVCDGVSKKGTSSAIFQFYWQEGLETYFSFTKTKRVFGTHLKARAGWPKRLALVSATPYAEFDIIGV